MTLQEWFRRRGGTQVDGPEVVVFPDTFNNRLHTRVGVACVEAIEAAGWRVVMPDGHVCCGRPLYDYGFLDTAQRYLRHVLDTLRPYIRAGTPIVGMEPSCLAVFKDEIRRSLPYDDDGKRLSANAYHFAEFFESFELPVPTVHGDALLWTHCHQRATGGSGPEQKLLERMGVHVRPVSGGCCGLAGSWGFERGKYDISVDCGEQALLPAVRAAEPDTAVVADGFSCQTQIGEVTERRALHVAELMCSARQGQEQPKPATATRAMRAAVPALAAAGAGLAAARIRRR
jgi:Fe-S oxidoreductase